jgi:hypothetical protein
MCNSARQLVKGGHRKKVITTLKERMPYCAHIQVMRLTPFYSECVSASFERRRTLPYLATKKTCNIADRSPHMRWRSAMVAMQPEPQTYFYSDVFLVVYPE